MRLLKRTEGAMVFEKAAEKRLANTNGRLEIKKSFVSEKKTGVVNANVSLFRLQTRLDSEMAPPRRDKKPAFPNRILGNRLGL